MAVIITNIKSSVTEEAESIVKKALKKISVREDEIKNTGIYKSSLDANSLIFILFTQFMLNLKIRPERKKFVKKIHFASTLTAK